MACFSNQNVASFDEATQTIYEKMIKTDFESKQTKGRMKKCVLVTR